MSSSVIESSVAVEFSI